MKQKLAEHILSILVVGGLLVWLIMTVADETRGVKPPHAEALGGYLEWEFLDFGNPLDRAIFRESVNALGGAGDSLLQAIDEYRREQFTNIRYKTGAEERGLTPSKLLTLGMMYAQFILVYVLVMALTYYGAQTLGVLRFVHMKQHRESPVDKFAGIREAVRSKRLCRLDAILRYLGTAALSLGKGVWLFVLFSPAYVIAYSIKTEFSTDSLLFMAALGVVSNGLLINYANRFFTLLVTESRKGYVETAMVKNLMQSYEWDTRDGISRRAVYRVIKEFPSHVFQHIFLNASHQFRLTLKEHASFLITGLVIIEMALNIQGHLSYEMLKNVLFRQYDVVLVIILGIFLLVKATEIAVDIRAARDAKRLGGREE